jgi:glycerophosphoryl diester phosphodiesterase
MNLLAITALLAELAVALPVHTSTVAPTTHDEYYISFGPRPYYLIQNMTESPLKKKLESCENGPFEVTAWSIGQ